MSNRLILGLVGLSSLGILLGRRKRKKVSGTLLLPCDQNQCRCTRHKLHILHGSPTSTTPQVGRSVQLGDTLTWVGREKGIDSFSINFKKGTETYVQVGSSPAASVLTSVPVNGSQEVSCVVAKEADDVLIIYTVTENSSKSKTSIEGPEQFIRNCKGC